MNKMHTPSKVAHALAAIGLLTSVATTAHAFTWIHHSHSSSKRARLQAPALPKLTSCSATRIVEMRNAVLATHLLCRNVITDQDYNWFIETNRTRIAQANKIAVQKFMKRDGSRKLFDQLDSVAMNKVALQASANAQFCADTAYQLRALVTSLPIDQLLEQQTLVPVPACDQ